MWTATLIITALVTALGLPPAVAAPALDPAGDTLFRVAAVRSTRPIVVDGRLDEADWARAPVATGFIQSEPQEGEPASEATEVRVLYDDETLYIGAFVAHRNAGDIIVNELTRDFDGSSTDWFAVILDPFHDRRNGYQFGVNPAGASWDSQKFNEGRERNLSWDGVWNVRTTVGADGWYAEYAIPFRTLQAPGGGPLTWGINFQRHLQGRQENSFWSPVPRQYGLDRLSRAGTLEGLNGIRRGLNLRVKPYASVRTRDRGADSIADAGIDVKYGITSSLTLDVTENTDFSQVEADLRQVGATRFSVLFPEKREFFLENSGVFQFGPGTDRSTQISASQGLSAGGRDNSVQNDLALFFSRRIGLSRSGDRVPLNVGARLSGKVGGLTVGALLIGQRAATGEPEARFTVLRARRNLLAASDVGVMLVDRDGPSRSSRVVGVDANVRPLRDLLIYGYAAKTLRADAAVGPEGRDVAARAGLGFRDGRWVFDSSYGVIGAGFVDEGGFVPRTGVARAQGLIGRRFRPVATASWLREIYPAVGVTHVRREDSGFDSRYWEQRLLMTFEGGATLEVGANPNEERLTSPFAVNRERGLIVSPGRYVFTDRFVAVSSSRSRRFAADLRLAAGSYYDGRRTLAQVGATGRVNTHLSGRVSLTRDLVDLPGGLATAHVGAGRINLGVSTRLFVSGLVQYDSGTRQWDTNLRVNYLYRPLSDVFVVFADRADNRSSTSDRSITLKVTRLLAF